MLLANGSLKFWDISTGAFQTLEDVHVPAPVSSEPVPVLWGSQALAWRPDGTSVASWGADGSVKIVDPVACKVTGEWALDPFVASAEGESNVAQLHEVTTGPWRSVFMAPLLWTFEGDRLLICRENGDVEIWAKFSDPVDSCRIRRLAL